MAPAEWRLLAWLEREGFAYDLFADQQLHDGTLDLAAYRVLVISVHPEYWSRRMLERVRDGWRTAAGSSCWAATASTARSSWRTTGARCGA